ncbi:GH22699 [Drosophila grimshawi]|uniref:GH22699 n=1 Tax=Drosophila grimshawi TaxID=7222 RepID=B4JVC1_DROGR|nr:GH22699 [Drosophila grimshawi]
MLLCGLRLVQRRQQQFMRSTCYWRRAVQPQRVAWSYGLQCNECTPLRLQARSRLGGGGVWLHFQFRCTASNKDNNKEAPVEKQPKEDAAKLQTKNYELKTSKGILSITTTIEDSKINEIVFEKTELSPVAKLNEPALNQVPMSDTTVLESAPTAITMLTETSAPKPAKETTEATEASAATAAPVTPPPPTAPKRPRFDYRISLEHQATLPYEQEPPMTVYWRRDVEAKALEVWGSRENIVRERLKREVERKQYQQNVFTVKRRLRDYRREVGSRTKALTDSEKDAEKSSQVVATAIAIEFVVQIRWLGLQRVAQHVRGGYPLAGGSGEPVDIGLWHYKSSQVPDTVHPYGYMNMRYVSSLISGVGIFCVGSGLSIYHGIEGILHPQPIADLFWVYCILAGSLVSEGATLMVAINELKRAAKVNNMSFKDYVIAGKDPCVNVVLCEDAAAVAGVMVAAGCMGLSSMTGSPLFDAAGSLVIGGLLGAVASFIIYTNANALVGVSITKDRLEKINAALEADVMIRAIYDVKGIDIGNGRVRYKAELDFDGRELTRSYLDKQDLNKLLTIVRGFRNADDLESFLLDQGESIVDLMGGEIDRIEMNLRRQFPEIRHVDLEIL